MTPMTGPIYTPIQHFGDPRMTTTLTGLPYFVGVALLAGGALALLLGLALSIFANRWRRPGPTAIDPIDQHAIDLDEILEPRTTAIPQIRPMNRRPGTLFVPHEGPETPEPTTTTPGE